MSSRRKTTMSSSSDDVDAAVGIIDDDDVGIVGIIRKKKKKKKNRRNNDNAAVVVKGGRNRSTKKSVLPLLVAVVMMIVLFIVWWQPLFLEHPRRAAREAAFYAAFVLNKLTGGQGTLNALDRAVLRWTNFNSQPGNIPPAVGRMAPAPIVELDASSNYTPEAFLRASNNRKTPVVVRGLFAHTRAAQKWTPDYLNATIGHLDAIALTDAPGCFAQHAGAIRNRTLKTTSQCKAVLRLGEFLRRMRAERLYVTQMSSPFASHPHIFVRDLELERFQSERVYPLEAHVVPTMFVGHGFQYPVQTTFHCAAAANYFVQVQGHKVWRLLPPEWTPYVQPLFHTDDTPALLSRCTCYEPETMMPPPPSSSNEGGGGPPCPAFERLPVQTVTLAPGDFLYLPPWWWHEIQHLSHGSNSNDDDGTGSDDGDGEYFLGVGLRPVHATAWQFVPGISHNWANTVGTGASYLRAFASLWKGGDWGSGNFHRDDRDRDRHHAGSSDNDDDNNNKDKGSAAGNRGQQDP